VSGLFHPDKDGDTEPRTGDTYVQLRCDPEQPLEKRIDLLSYAFAKTVQGAHLKTIMKWDMVEGVIEFVVGGGPNVPGPRGRLVVDLADWPPKAEALLPEVELEVHTVA